MWRCQGTAYTAIEILEIIFAKASITVVSKKAVLLPLTTAAHYCSAVVLSSDNGMKKISLWRPNSLVGASYSP